MDAKMSSPSECPHDPTQTFGPIGMYHCPECGEMQVAGFKHTRILSEEDYEAIEDPNKDE